VHVSAHRVKTTRLCLGLSIESS